MEAQQQYSVQNPRHHKSNAGRIFGGFIVLIAGILLLARQSGVGLPWWIFTWQMILITVGLYVGVRNSFRGWSWFILIALGLFFFMDDFLVNLEIKRYIWPTVIILIGLIMIFRSVTRNTMTAIKYTDENKATGGITNNDFINSTTLFGGIKKNIVSKDFQGGEATTIFGGTELNLMNANLTATRSLELTQIFGGTKLIVPAGWNIITDDVVAILGGVDDKRTIRQAATESDKILRLRGTCIFGGIDIVSY